MGCFGFLKIMMFAFNGIIFVAGAAILGIGIWVKVDSGSILGLLENLEDAPSELSQLLNVGYLLIAVGAVLLIIGFLGCCGAIKESRCMLLLFFIILLVIFIAEVAGAVVILVFKPLAEELINKLGTKAVANIKKDYGKNEDITGLWNTTMDTLQCCGFYNYTDFEDSPYYTSSSGLVPHQCCLDTNSTCDSAAAAAAGAKTVVGCYPRIQTLIDDNSTVIAAVALGIAALEVCAMIVSMILYRKIGSKRG